MSVVPGRAKAGSHQLPDAEYAAMLEAQDGGCAIRSADYRCAGRAITRRYHTDRDHKTGEVRGLLCMGHNRRLWNSATPAELRAMADYLERAAS